MRAILTRITIIFAFLSLFSSSARPAVINVPGDFPRIQEAINAANDGDTVLVYPGTYQENLIFYGKAITVESQQGANVTTIDGSNPWDPSRGSTVLFENGEGPNSVIKGFTIKGGSGRLCFSPSPQRFGGGICCEESSSPKILDNIITGNIATCGGGIGCVKDQPPRTGDPIIKNNTITINTGIGGGIFCYNYLGTIENNTITNNKSSCGGGIYLDDSSPIVKNNIIAENTGNGGGGGISCVNGACSATITDNTITGNLTQTGGIGGGFYCVSSFPTISRNIIDGNFGGTRGGGIYFGGSTTTIKNNIISGNSADCGGGVYCEYSSTIVMNNTIYGNSSLLLYAGGVYSDKNSLPQITNSIIWGNGPINGIFGTFIRVSYSDVEGGYVGTGNIDVNPLFVDAFNGDFHLRLGSPCCDAGSNDAASLPETDYEGDLRIIDGNWPQDGEARVDMGADELLCEIAARFGNVNAKYTSLDNVLLMNGSPGNSKRVFSTTRGTAMTLSMGTPFQGPTASPFALYVIQREPGLSDIAQQPYGIGKACMPMPLTHGINPPPFCIANSIGYFSLLGYPIMPWVKPAPCTIIDIPYGFPQGTYTLQGYIMDNGAKSLTGLSLTNAIVVKVQ